jgi:hypothetical protein
MVREFDEIFDECVNRINRGEKLEDCLDSYPEHVRELQPLLRTMIDTQRTYTFRPSPAAKIAARQRFHNMIESLEQKHKQRRILSLQTFRWSKAWATAVAILVVVIAGYFGLKVFLAPVSYAGLLEMRVTDAQTWDVSEVIVSVDDIQVQKAGVEEDGEWLSVIDEEKTFDLLALSGVEEVLGSKSIEATEYNNIRMEVLSMTATIDGEEKAATVPSGKLKLVTSFTVKANSKTILTLDFDVDKSVVVTGMGKVLFKPVIKVLVREEA